jgi:hypothetical protein
LKIDQRFERICHIHLHGRRIHQARNYDEAGGEYSLNGLLFRSEDGGDMFLQNVDWFFSGLYGVISPRKHRCGDRRPYRCKYVENRKFCFLS